MLYDNRPLTIMHLKAALKHIHTAIYDHMENVIDSMDDSPESEEQALARMLEVKRLLNNLCHDAALQDE